MRGGQRAPDSSAQRPATTRGTVAARLGGDRDAAEAWALKASYLNGGGGTKAVLHLCKGEGDDIQTDGTEVLGAAGSGAAAGDNVGPVWDRAAGAGQPRPS